MAKLPASQNDQIFARNLRGIIGYTFCSLLSHLKKKHATLLKIYYFFILCSFFVQHSNSHLFLRYVRLENMYEFIGKGEIFSVMSFQLNS